MTVVLGRQTLGANRRELRGFPVTAGCEGNWLFESASTAPDRSGNGYDLTRHTAGYECAIYDGEKKGSLLDGLFWWSTTVAAAPNLNQQGALTLELLYSQIPLRQASASQVELLDYASLIACREASTAGGASGSQAAYSVGAGLTSGPFSGLYYSHTGAGPTLVTSPAIRAMPAPGQPGVLHITRPASATSISVYCNGVLHGTFALSVPPSCAPNTFYIGSTPYSAGHYALRGGVYAAAVHSLEMPAATVLARARYVRGLS